MSVLPYNWSYQHPYCQKGKKNLLLAQDTSCYIRIYEEFSDIDTILILVILQKI
jgi:hypothetical protein